jgi:ATP-dependent helicase HrpA
MGLDSDLPFAEEAYAAILARGKSEVITRANEMESVLLNFLKVLAELRHKLAGLDAGKWADSRADIEQQLRHLLQAGFQRDTPREWSAQYPRYLKALRTRVERLSGQYTKDQKHTALLHELAQPLWDSVEKRPGLFLLCAPARQYRWMLEELRVSLFAQNLGTRQAVSQKRLQEQWRSVQQWLDKNHE